MKRDYILNESTRLSFRYVIFYIKASCDSCMMDENVFGWVQEVVNWILKDFFNLKQQKHFSQIENLYWISMIKDVRCSRKINRF